MREGFQRLGRFEQQGRIIVMRTTILVMAVIAIVEFLPGPSVAAIYYPWCAQYAVKDGASPDCSFITRDQCMASVAGNMGYCLQNPKPPSVYQGSAVPLLPTTVSGLAGKAETPRRAHHARNRAKSER
jgi:hypothetical protein